MSQTSFRDAALSLTAACFAGLADDDAALFARAGAAGTIPVPAMVDYKDVEIEQANGAVVVERRPVVSLPASAVRPVPRGSTVSINGTTYTVDFVLSDDEQVVQAVCHG